MLRRAPASRPARAVLLAVLLGLGCGLAPPAAAARPLARARATAPLRYRVAIPDPASQYVEVELTLSDRRGATTLAMPAWTPGSYLIRDHARHVYDLRAERLDGRPLAVERVDKQTWRIRHDVKDIRVRYRVFADELGVRTAHVDDRHAALLGPAIFLYVVGDTARPAVLSIALPPGWRAFTALPAAPAPAGEARFTAPSYDALVDAPIELGAPELRRRLALGKAIELVFTAPAGHNADLDRLADDLARIAAALGAMMGGLPFERYVFLVHAAAVGGGGLEHADSTSLQVRRDAFTDDAAYARFAHLAAHEFFHLWNVKRIRDRDLLPYDYTRESYTRLLWFHEGFTETIENLALVRAGITPPADYLRELADGWTAYVRKPGRNRRPIGEHSFDAWIHAYKPAANHGAAIVSYYEKGALLGVALDLELRLRAAARGRPGALDGLFRRLMRSHGARGRGVTQDDILAAASAEAGEDMRDFFARYIDGAEEIPLLALLPRIGVKVEATAPWEAEAPTLAQRRARAWSGLRTQGLKIVDIEPGSPAALAGLMLGDEVLAVAGHRTRGDAELREHLADHPPGASAALTVFRGDRLVERRLTLGESPHRAYRFELVPDADLAPSVKALRDAWLAGPDTAPPGSRASAQRLGRVIE